jgi:hypothetical protein
MLSVWGKIFAVLGVLVMACLSSCETAFQINAENQEVPILYCNLNTSSDTQYLKLNKTYLIEEAASEYPPHQDSIYFSGDIQVVLESWKNGIVEEVFIFEPTTDIPKDTGFFPNEKNIIYKTQARIFPQTKYSISVYIEDEEKVVYAETESLGKLKIIDPLDIPERKVSLNIGQNYTCRWKPVDNAGIYQVIVDFYYMEYEGEDSTQQVFEWPQAFTSPKTNAESLSKDISGSRFFNILDEHIPIKEGVIRRAQGMDFTIISGGEEIKFYIESTAPSDGALMEKPVYSNITNGLGVFSTFSKAIISKLPIGSVTIDSLAYSQHTNQLGFLDHNGVRLD